MNTQEPSKTLASAGIIAAIAASLCCITPLLALLAGVGGVASIFSWMEPLRPYLIGATILVLGIAWYQALKPKKADDCCDTDCVVEKKKFISSKRFLGLITVLAVLMMAFPFYGQIFYPKAEKNITVATDKTNIEQATFTIEGMTCASCEEHVNSDLSKVKGVTDFKTSSETGESIVTFDKTQVNKEAIRSAINKPGYTVTNVITK